MVKNLPANAGYVDWIPGLGRSPGEGNGNPLQYSLENPMDRGAWRATVHGGHKKSDTTEHTHAHTHTDVSGSLRAKSLRAEGRQSRRTAAHEAQGYPHPAPDEGRTEGSSGCY